MPKGGCSKTPQPEDFSLSNDMVEKQTGKKDKDKVSLTKTPKLDRSDGGKEVKERTTKRKLPFTVGTNGDQKDSDTAGPISQPGCRHAVPALRGGWEQRWVFHAHTPYLLMLFAGLGQLPGRRHAARLLGKESPCCSADTRCLLLGWLHERKLKFGFLK
uniref:Ankyrin repeat domain containing 11 n=1 Tax=Gallus gallus TaxID=9031 RepID=A0A8V0XV44_CHICK